MRLAIFSDIHSNNVALRTCIDEIKEMNIDGICLLGDYVSDCPDPQATLKLIKELKKNYKTWVIKGNREQYFIDHNDGFSDGWAYTSYKGSLLYTYENLTKEDIEFFRNLPNSLTVHIPDTEPLLLAHGSPSSLKELLHDGGENTKCHMKEMDTNYLLAGHTHVQTFYKYQKKVLINPGSVGVAIGERATAHYCILEWKDEGWKPTFKSVFYDYNKICESFHRSSLIKKAGVWPYCIMKSIDTGTNHGPLCAKRAFDIATNEGITIPSTGIPEKYWEIAAKEMNIINSNSYSSHCENSQ